MRTEIADGVAKHRWEHHREEEAGGHDAAYAGFASGKCSDRGRHRTTRGKDGQDARRIETVHQPGSDHPSDGKSGQSPQQHSFGERQIVTGADGIADGEAPHHDLRHPAEELRADPEHEWTVREEGGEAFDRAVVASDAFDGDRREFDLVDDEGEQQHTGADEEERCHQGMGKFDAGMLFRRVQHQLPDEEAHQNADRVKRLGKVQSTDSAFLGAQTNHQWVG